MSQQNVASVIARALKIMKRENIVMFFIKKNIVMLMMNHDARYFMGHSSEERLFT